MLRNEERKVKSRNILYNEKAKEKRIKGIESKIY